MERTKLVAFTFDDGPVAYGENSTAMNILRTLEKYGQKATFFYVGEKMNEENKKEIQYAKKLGCEIGNHTFTHCFLNQKTEAEIKEEYAKTSKLLEEYTGEAPALVRNPYLIKGKEVTDAVDFPMISCSVDSADWTGNTAEDIIERIMKADAEGRLDKAVVLMHETYEATMKAVEYLIPTLMEKGYRFVTVPELAKSSGIILEKHKIYGRFQ